MGYVHCTTIQVGAPLLLGMEIFHPLRAIPCHTYMQKSRTFEHVSHFTDALNACRYDIFGLIWRKIMQFSASTVDFFSDFCWENTWSHAWEYLCINSKCYKIQHFASLKTKSSVHFFLTLMLISSYTVRYPDFNNLNHINLTETTLNLFHGKFQILNLPEKCKRIKQRRKAGRVFECFVVLWSLF